MLGREPSGGIQQGFNLRRSAEDIETSPDNRVVFYGGRFNLLRSAEDIETASHALQP